MWLAIPAVDAGQGPPWLRTLRQHLSNRKIDNDAGEREPIVTQLRELGVSSRRLFFVGGTDRVRVDAGRRTAHGSQRITRYVRAGTADIEIMDMSSPSVAAATDGRIGMPLAATAGQRREWPAMTIHQIDVALSAGRQAVERARLQQIGLLIAQAIGSDSRNLISALRLQRQLGPYQALRHHGKLEHAALAGVALAAAQLGLPLILAGHAARIAADLAIAINAKAAEWVLFPR